MTRRFFSCLGAALLGAATGCLPGTTGELSNGEFTYFCASDDDLACRDDLFGASGVPDAIAVGAHFDLQFDPDGVGDSATVTPASRAILTSELGLGTHTTGFRFTAPGTVAVLARDGSRIIDFVHVTGALLDRVTLSDRQGEMPTQIDLSTSTFGDTLTATPRSDLGVILAGALQYDWETSDSKVVSLSQGIDPNEVTLVPEGPGTATITVTVKDQQASIDVTVGGSP